MNEKSGIIYFLKSIPTYRDGSKDVQEILDNYENANLTISEKRVLFKTTIIYLKLFDVVELNNNKVKLKDTTPLYFINSLIWYIENDISIFSNWSRQGAANMIDSNKILDQPQYFLKIMDSKRLSLINENNLNEGVTRNLDVVILLINRRIDNKLHFLYQIDQHSGGYQLIGGKVKNGELILEAAKRELDEEIKNHNLIFSRDYNLTQLNQRRIEECFISESTGALTKYNFYLFHVHFKIKEFTISKELDKWIPIEFMRRGVSEDSRKIAYHEFINRFDSEINGGLEGLSISVNTAPEQVQLSEKPIKKSDHTIWDKIKYVSVIIGGLSALILGFAKVFGWW